MKFLLCVLSIVYVESTVLGTLDYTERNKVVDAHQKLCVDINM